MEKKPHIQKTQLNKPTWVVPGALPTHNKPVRYILNTDRDGTVPEGSSHSTITSNAAKLLRVNHSRYLSGQHDNAC